MLINIRSIFFGVILNTFTHTLLNSRQTMLFVKHDVSHITAHYAKISLTSKYVYFIVTVFKSAEII